jgi:hypothetical protein
VTDLAPAGTGDAASLADRVGREVVVQVEVLFVLLVDAVDDRFVVGRAERDGDVRLRLAAREQGRAVHPRDEVRDDRDLADLVRAAAVGAPAFDDRLALDRADQSRARAC